MAVSRRDAAVRALSALLKVNGVRVRLRMPALASAGDEAEQLGLATPGFEDLELGPGLLRSAGTELLLSASAASGGVLFVQAAGVLVGEELRGVVRWTALRAGEGVYGYLLTLRAPGA